MLRRLFGSGSRQKPVPPPSPATPDEGGEQIATDATFATLVLERDGLVVVDFWAEWCQPCQVMSAFVEFLARDFAGRLHVVSLDVDENPATSERYQVQGLPTLIYFRDGLEVERVVGVGGYDQLKRQTARLLEEPTDAAGL